MTAPATYVSWPEQQGRLFQERFAEWEKCRAELAELSLEILYGDKDASGIDLDARHDDLAHRLENAARLSMTTYVPDADLVWKKFQILEDALHGTGDCEWTDNRQVWMLACIKADLMSIGIGRLDITMLPTRKAR